MSSLELLHATCDPLACEDEFQPGECDQMGHHVVTGSLSVAGLLVVVVLGAEPRFWGVWFGALIG